MNTNVALFTLAHRRRDVSLVCEDCGHRVLEPIEYLVAGLGPMFPLARVGDGRVCRKCCGRRLKARPA